MFRYLKTCKMGVDLEKYREYQLAYNAPKTKPMGWFMKFLTGVDKPTTIEGFIQVWFRGVNSSVRDIGTKMTYGSVDEYTQGLKEVEEELELAFSDKEKARVAREALEAEQKKRDAPSDWRKPMPIPPERVPEIVKEDSLILHSYASSGTFCVGDKLIGRADEILQK